MGAAVVVSIVVVVLVVVVVVSVVVVVVCAAVFVSVVVVVSFVVVVVCDVLSCLSTRSWMIEEGNVWVIVWSRSKVVLWFIPSGCCALCTISMQ